MVIVYLSEIFIVSFAPSSHVCIVLSWPPCASLAAPNRPHLHNDDILQLPHNGSRCRANTCTTVPIPVRLVAQWKVLFPGNTGNPRHVSQLTCYANYGQAANPLEFGSKVTAKFVCCEKLAHQRLQYGSSSLTSLWCQRRQGIQYHCMLDAILHATKTLQAPFQQCKAGARPRNNMIVQLMVNVLM